MLDLIFDPFVQTGLLALIGGVLTRLAFRKHRIGGLIGQWAFFVFLTGLLLYHGIIPYEPGPPASSLQRIFIGLAKIIWWLNAAWSLIGMVRVFLTFERKPREGRLLQDLVVGVIYIGALLSVIAYVFNGPVGTLIATSGVFAIILGLALQSTLSDVFSGVALNLSRPYGIGDWLVLSSGIEGRVVETNWRATHLLNGTNDLVIVPNSDLAKARLTNLSNPDRSHGVNLTVRFRPSTEPVRIMEVMQTVLLSSNTILATPQPGVQVTALDANAVELELSFSVLDMTVAGKAKSEILDLVYRHAKATGLFLAPQGEGLGIGWGPSDKTDHVTATRTTQLRLLDAIALFSSLTEDEKEVLAASMTRRTFRKDEILAKQGEVLKSLMILRSGVAVIKRRESEMESELTRLAPGNFFGEGGLLTGAGEPGTVQALTFVVVYEITQEGLAKLMRDRPTIAEELGVLLARRTAQASHLHESGPTRTTMEIVPGLVARIRHLFEL